MSGSRRSTEEAIKEMCDGLRCTLDPDDCVYSLDRFFRGRDCNGPFVEEKK